MIKINKPILLILLSSLVLPVSIYAIKDIYIARVAIFSTLGSYVYMYNKNYKPQLSSKYNTQISYTSGKEFSSNTGRYLKNNTLFIGIAWNKKIIENKYFTLKGRTDLSVSKWHSSNKKIRNTSYNPNGFIYAITNFFTYNIKSINILNHHIYIDTGMGASLMDSKIVENRNKSSYFQFSDSIGFGIKNKSNKIGYKFTHISNANISKPNPGIDLHQIEIGYTFNIL